MNMRIKPIAFRCATAVHISVIVVSGDVRAMPYIWAFADYTDANIAKIRTAVSALQKAEQDVTYTEFPFDESKSTAEKAAAVTGLVNWITTDVTQPKTVDLVLFAGQSNMAGRGAVIMLTRQSAFPGH